MCPKCKQRKPIEEFIREPRNKDGYSWCRTCWATKTRIWRDKNRLKVRALGKRGYIKHQELRQETGRMGHRERKVRVLTHYGSGKLACVACGFSDIRALSIDHINGGGLKHRKSLGISGGSGFYLWLERNGLPEGYQMLCMNCQYTKKVEYREV